MLVPKSGPKLKPEQSLVLVGGSAALGGWHGMHGRAYCPASGQGRQGEGLALRLVGPDSLMQARSLFSRHGLWVLVLSRPVPVLAEATAVLAGLGAMPPGPLALTAGLSNLGLAALYAWVGSSGRGELGLGALFGGAVLLPGLGLLLSRVVRRGALSA